MTDNIARPAQPEITDSSAKLDPNYLVTPRSWIQEQDVLRALGELGWKRRWLLVQKKVTSPTNERTHLATLLPLSGTTESLHTILVPPKASSHLICALTANLNVFPFDFAARQKLGGVNFNYFVLQQLPILPPDRYTPDLLAFIVPRVLELTYTAWDLRAFADDVWAEADDALRAALLAQWEACSRRFSAQDHGAEAPTTNEFPRPPFTWDEERRAQLRADLDALYAQLYGLTREELDYILDTFPIVKRRDEEKYREYRTKRLVLEAFDGLQGGIR